MYRLAKESKVENWKLSPFANALCLNNLKINPRKNLLL